MSNDDDIIDAEIIEDSDENTEPDLADAVPAADLVDDTDEYKDIVRTERTAAFIVDSRTSTIALSETISRLLAEQHIQRGIVDVASEAGLVIAGEFQKAGIPYDVINYGQDMPESGPGPHSRPEAGQAVTTEHAPWLLEQAAGVVTSDPPNLVELDANLFVIPAMDGAGQIRIDTIFDGKTHSRDLSMTTLPGLVVEAAHQRGEAVTIIDTVEYGLIQEADGSYHRRIIHLTPDDG